MKAGAPEGIIGWIDQPSLELTNMLMREVDIILATGGPGMVKAAYSSGKPALGVGAGNTPVVIDDTAEEAHHLTDDRLLLEGFDQRLSGTDSLLALSFGDCSALLENADFERNPKGSSEITRKAFFEHPSIVFSGNRPHPEPQFYAVRFE